MLDEELDQLLNQWSQQSRLRDAELSAMLADIIPAESPVADPAAPWITFWQQIGRLVRTEERLVDLCLLPLLPAASVVAYSEL